MNRYERYMEEKRLRAVAKLKPVPDFAPTEMEVMSYEARWGYYNSNVNFRPMLPVAGILTFLETP